MKKPWEGEKREVRVRGDAEKGSQRGKKSRQLSIHTMASPWQPENREAQCYHGNPSLIQGHHCSHGNMKTRLQRRIRELQEPKPKPQPSNWEWRKAEIRTYSYLPHPQKTPFVSFLSLLQICYSWLEGCLSAKGLCYPPGYIYLAQLIFTGRCRAEGKRGRL